MRKYGFIILISLFVQITVAQVRKVTGLVLDSSNQIIPGANVRNLNSHKGVSTNFDGVFTIDAAPQDFLEFSFMGMKSYRVKADKEKINVVLKDSDVVLEEIVPHVPRLVRSLNTSSPINQKNIINRSFIATLQSNVCKDNFSSSFFKELSFEKDFVIVTDFYTRSNDFPDFRYYTKYEKYSYSFKKGKIIIDNPEIESLALVQNIFIVNRLQVLRSNKGQIFTEFLFDIRGKSYEGCNGLGCTKKVNGGFSTSDCIKFDFGDSYVYITSYQKNSGTEAKLNNNTKSYRYERIGNKIIMKDFVYNTVLFDTNQLGAVDSNGKNLNFKRIK